MKLNNKLNKLGTETAFAVSAEAKSWAKKGHKVFPFLIAILRQNLDLRLILKS